MYCGGEDCDQDDVKEGDAACYYEEEYVGFNSDFDGWAIMGVVGAGLLLRKLRGCSKGNGGSLSSANEDSPTGFDTRTH